MSQHASRQCVQGGQLEVVAASVVHLGRVAVDRATARQAWDSAAALRHFSIVQQLEGQPWPQGTPLVPAWPGWAAGWWCGSLLQIAAHRRPASRTGGPGRAYRPCALLTQLCSPRLSCTAAAGFAEAVKAANASPAGKRNGGAMLSMQGSERALLQSLVARLHALGADVLVGHNISAGDLSLLLQRLQHHKVRHPRQRRSPLHVCH